MRANRLLMATMAAMFVMTVVPQTGSFASSGKGRDGSGQGGANTVAGSEVRFVAKLLPPPDVDPLFEGHAAWRSRGTTRGEFEARVEVPLSALNVDTYDTLKPVLTLSGGMQCTMVFDRDDSMLGVAEYKVSVRSRDGVVTNRAGFCGQEAQHQFPGVPDGQSALVTIVTVTPPGSVPLQGSFVLKR